MAHSSGGRKRSYERTHCQQDNVSESAAFAKNLAHLKPIKYSLLPFGVYFKG